MQLFLWAPDPPRPARQRAEAVPPAEALARRLRQLGFPGAPRIVTHRNHQVMVSWTPARTLRLHEGYLHAPDDVLEALVRFLTPGTRRATRLAARRRFLAFPVEEFAPGKPRGEPRARPGDETAVARLTRMHQELNHRHFGGALGEIPILLSGRMRRRLGELRLDRKTGSATRITLSRRHLRRDGWAGITDTLLHEMVHQWQAETGRPVDHGREFRRKARELGITPRATTDEIRRGPAPNPVSSAWTLEDGAA